MERWGITPYISACYAAPFIMANISSDPANPAAEAWWTHKVAEIKALMPTFGGFVVSCHDIVGIWVAFFSTCQRYRCRQGHKARRP